MTLDQALSAAQLAEQIQRYQQIVDNLNAAISAGAIIAKLELTQGILYGDLTAVLSSEESSALLGGAFTLFQSKLSASQAELAAL